MLDNVEFCLWKNFEEDTIEKKLIDGSVKSYCYILNYPEWLDVIKKVNRLEAIIGDFESDHFGAKYEKKKGFL